MGWRRKKLLIEILGYGILDLRILEAVSFVPKPASVNPPPGMFPTVFGNIHFDKFGFPNFINHVSSPNHIFEFPNLAGKDSDFTLAKTKLQEYLTANAGGTVKKKKSTQSSWSPFYIEKNGVQEGPFTWHHHQDGETLMPIKSEVHEAVNPHTGGNTIALNYAEL